MNVPDDTSSFYQCEPMIVFNSSSSFIVGKVIGNLASRKTTGSNVDNALDRSEITDSFTSQLTMTTTDTIADSLTSEENISLITTTLEDSKSVVRYQFSTLSHNILEGNHNLSLSTETSNIDSTIKNTRGSLMNSLKDITNVTTSEGSREGITSTKMAQKEQREACLTTAAANMTTTQKPTPRSNQPKAIKHKKVAKGYETKTKTKERYLAKEATKLHSNVDISTVSSLPLISIQGLHRSSVSHSTLAHRQKDKVVVDQNKLVFNSDKHKVSSVPPTSNENIARESNQEKATTISPLWGMIEEVAYDTKRKSILKS